VHAVPAGSAKQEEKLTRVGLGVKLAVLVADGVAEGGAVGVPVPVRVWVGVRDGGVREGVGLCDQ
jgi:hypothetical protein